MIIYKATFPNKKSYIGQTKNKLSIRQMNHKYRAITLNSNSAFHCAIRKYGFNNIIWEILENCSSWEQMQKREEFLVKYYKTISPNGYNEKDGGRQPKETEKIKQKRIKNNPKYWLNKKFSDSHKKNISNGHKGKKKPYLKISKNAKRAVTCISKDGEIREFSSLTEASNYVNGNISAISQAIKGITKTSSGYYWRFNNKKLK